MAIQTIEQLKAWFRRGLYPTEEQFADLIDSFRHRREEVSLIEITGLAQALNNKYDASLARILELKVGKHETDIIRLQEEQENQGLTISEILLTDEAQQESIDFLLANFIDKTSDQSIYGIKTFTNAIKFDNTHDTRVILNLFGKEKGDIGYSSVYDGVYMCNSANYSAVGPTARHAFVIKDDGTVLFTNCTKFGFGTTSPSYPFHVIGETMMEGKIHQRMKAEDRWPRFLESYSEDMVAGQCIQMHFGKGNTDYNCGYMRYHHLGDANNQNFIAFGAPGTSDLLTIRFDGCVGVGATPDSKYRLKVNGGGSFKFTYIVR